MRRVATITSLALLMSAWILVACAEAGGGNNVLSAAQVRERMSADEVLVLDVRTPTEYERGHVDGAVNIPYDEVGGRIEEIRHLAAGCAIVLYCRTGHRAGIAESTLAAQGFHDLWQLDGSYSGWISAGFPTATGR